MALTLARRHRPAWSWRRWRWVCRCGADLPCHSRHRIPINRGHWPDQDDPGDEPSPDLADLDLWRLRADWPCGPGRRQLLAEYRDARVALTLYLAAQLVTAGRDLARFPAGQLHHRFLGWTR